jgi:hypothetical protein
MAKIHGDLYSRQIRSGQGVKVWFGTKQVGDAPAATCTTTGTTYTLSVTDVRHAVVSGAYLSPNGLCFAGSV